MRQLAAAQPQIVFIWSNSIHFEDLLNAQVADGAQTLDSMYNVHASMDMHRFSDRLRAFDRKFIVDKDGKCRSVTGRP
jgi:hypothetical protein